MISEHRFASNRLCAYRDGVLPEGAAHRLCDHLARCEDCRGALAELTALASRLRAFNAPAPDGLAERVIAYLDAESAAARLSIVSPAGDDLPSRPGAATVALRVARAHLRRTLPLALLIGVLITVIKDLGALLADGLTLETCTVCGANFVAAFVVLNIGLLLALPQQRHSRQRVW